MTITLDDATEQIVQRELARGHFTDANELIRHAVTAIGQEPDAEELQLSEDWLLRNRDAIRRGVEESMADVAAGRTYSPDEVRDRLAARRAARAA